VKYLSNSLPSSTDISSHKHKICVHPNALMHVVSSIFTRFSVFSNDFLWAYLKLFIMILKHLLCGYVNVDCLQCSGLVYSYGLFPTILCCVSNRLLHNTSKPTSQPTTLSSVTFLKLKVFFFFTLSWLFRDVLLLISCILSVCYYYILIRMQTDRVYIM